MHRRQFAFVMVLILVPIFAVCGAAPKSNQDRLVESFGGNERMQILRSADKVQAMRIDDSHDQESAKDFRVVGRPVELNPKIAEKFSRILADHRSYEWSDAAKSCTPAYGVQLRFTKGKLNLDVIFCFHCDSLLTCIDGKPVGNASFDNGHDELARLFQQVFPKDEGIQSIRLRTAGSTKTAPSSGNSAPPRRIKL